jgi:hypothetical protein
MTHHRLQRFKREIPIALGIILFWRGVWVLLDLFDHWLFGGSHLITALLGVGLGIALLYFSDNEFKYLERL